MSKPIIALDVDGVINFFAESKNSRIQQISVPAEHVPVSRYLRRDMDGGIQGMVNFDPDHGVWINKMIGLGVEFVWATTWEQAANQVWPELLGIPEFPLGVSGLETQYTGLYDSSTWKMVALTDKYTDPDQAVVWIDDTAQKRFESLREGPTLALRTNPYKGLTEEDMKEVEEFIKDFL